jgi:hypothetical protein
LARTVRIADVVVPAPLLAARIRNGLAGADVPDTKPLRPVCTHHHTRVHDAGWNLRLGPNRELTITFPDGTVHNTGPPSRRAA